MHHSHMGLYDIPARSISLTLVWNLPVPAPDLVIDLGRELAENAGFSSDRFIVTVNEAERTIFIRECKGEECPDAFRDSAGDTADAIRLRAENTDALQAFAPSETERVVNYQLERGVGIRIWHKPWFSKKVDARAAQIVA